MFQFVSLKSDINFDIISDYNIIQSDYNLDALVLRLDHNKFEKNLISCQPRTFVVNFEENYYMERACNPTKEFAIVRS